MAEAWKSLLQRWLDAGLLDSATAGRIRAWEAEHGGERRLRWPTIFAWTFGGVLLAAGVLLFVAAHWDEISPAARFSLALLQVALFHLAGAVLAERLPALARVLHAVGTVALGAGIFLTGQIFHLQEHWPGGVMLWAAGAWLGWALLRDWPQAALAAVLTPVWLAGEWGVATNNDSVMAHGLLLLSFTYLSARTAQRDSPIRHALSVIGGLMLIPFTFFVLYSHQINSLLSPELSGRLSFLGWLGAFGLPLGLAWLLRGRAAWMNGVAALWVLVLGTLAFRPGATDSLLSYAWRELGPYLWCGAGSLALVGWGLAEQRKERINLGVAGFALTVLFFYFSTVMDKLGRSGSLIGLGALFLVGGWMLERARRRLVARLAGGEKS